MGSFTCRSRDATGSVVVKTIDAASRRDAIHCLMDSGLVPIKIVEERTGRQRTIETSSDGQGTSQRSSDRRIKRLVLMNFTLQIASALDAGVPLLAALDSASKQSGDARFRTILHEIVADIQGGLPLSVATRNYPKAFPEVYSGTLAAGEQSGMLDQMLTHLAEFLEADIEVQSDVRSALLYPAFVIASLCLAITVLVVFIVPRFATFYSGFGADLPLITRVLIDGTSFITGNLLLVLVGIAAFVYGAQHLVRTSSGRRFIDRAALRVPVLGKMLETALTLRSMQLLGLSCQAGLPLTDGLGLVQRTVPNTKFREDFEPVIQGVTTGESLSRCLEDAECLPPTARQMLATGETSGSLEKACFAVAKQAKRDLRYFTKNLSTLIEPMLTLVLAGVILFVALAVFLPMWDLTKVIGQ